MSSRFSFSRARGLPRQSEASRRSGFGWSGGAGAGTAGDSDDAVRASPARGASVAGDGVPTVLVVCTGNICRSAYLHHRLAAALKDAGGESAGTMPGSAVRVISAGTGVNPRLRVPEPIIEAARGVAPGAATSLEQHRPSTVRAPLIEQASLVLTATDAHAEQVLTEVPGAARRVFTILDFAAAAQDLLAEADVASADAAPAAGDLTAWAERAQRWVAAETSPTRDLPDPFRRGDAAYARMAETLEPAVDVIAAVLRRASRPQS
ncbi:MAG: hypothetical protein Q4G34_00485 [Micrococcus sp.]|nr:hypothetical protein [Micrococcus sp.]